MNLPSADVLAEAGSLVSLAAFAVCLAALACSAVLRERAATTAGARAGTPSRGRRRAVRAVVVAALAAGGLGMVATMVRLLATVYS